MTKILSWVFGILLTVSVIFGGYSLYLKNKLEDTNSALNDKLMEMDLDLGKAHTEFGNAQKHISDLQSKLKDALKDNNELIVAYGELEAKYNSSGGSTGSGSIGDTTPVDDNEFEPGMWYMAINKSDLVKFESISFLHKDFRINIRGQVYPLSVDSVNTDVEYDISMKLVGQLVQSATKSGAVNHYFNLFEIDDDGNMVGELKLEKFEVTVDKPDDKEFFWWSPHVDVGVFLGMADKIKPYSGASVGFTSSGYGLTKNDLSWKFFRLGVDFSSDALGLSFSPAAYNLGEALPLISNLYLSPYISAMSNGRKSAGLLLSVGL